MSNQNSGATRDKNPWLTIAKLIGCVSLFMAFFQATHSALLLQVTGHFIEGVSGHSGGTAWLVVATWIPTFLTQFCVWFFIFFIASVIWALIYALLGLKQMSAGSDYQLDMPEKQAQVQNLLHITGKLIVFITVVASAFLVTLNMITEVVLGHFASASTIQLVLLFITGWLASFPIYLFVIGGILSIVAAMILLLLAFFSNRSGNSGS